MVLVCYKQDVQHIPVSNCSITSLLQETVNPVAQNYFKNNIVIAQAVLTKDVQ